MLAPFPGCDVIARGNGTHGRPGPLAPVVDLQREGGPVSGQHPSEVVGVDRARPICGPEADSRRSRTVGRKFLQVRDRADASRIAPRGARWRLPPAAGGNGVRDDAVIVAHASTTRRLPGRGAATAAAPADRPRRRARASAEPSVRILWTVLRPVCRRTPRAANIPYLQGADRRRCCRARGRTAPRGLRSVCRAEVRVHPSNATAPPCGPVGATPSCTSQAARTRRRTPSPGP